MGTQWGQRSGRAQTRVVRGDRARVRLMAVQCTHQLQGPAAFAQRANLRRPDTRSWDAVRTVTLSAGLQSDSTLNLRRPTLRTNLRLSGDAGLMRG